MLSLTKVKPKQSYIDKLDWWSEKGIEECLILWVVNDGDQCKKGVHICSRGLRNLYAWQHKTKVVELG